MGMLDGKIAVVTGAGRGIGRETAILFAKEGAYVVINDIDEEPAMETLKEIEKIGGKGLVCTGDVSKKSDCERLMKTAAEVGNGSIDILANIAGITRDAVIHKMPEEWWDLVINVNLKGTFNCIQAAAPYMRDVAKREKEKGIVKHRKIINTSSTAALRGNPGQINYVAAKEGIIGITKVVAREWGSFYINCNCVAPGFTETRLTAPKKEGDIIGVPPEQREATIKMIPFGRPATPLDIAKVFLFFASHLSDYVTGQVINVSGGLVV
jgi:3-oxoacyl-[acyl-carrier protein] reductase